LILKSLEIKVGVKMEAGLINPDRSNPISSYSKDEAASAIKKTGGSTISHADAVDELLNRRHSVKTLAESRLPTSEENVTSLNGHQFTLTEGSKNEIHPDKQNVEEEAESRQKLEKSFNSIQNSFQKLVKQIKNQ
jgi:hypothetical protein